MFKKPHVGYKKEKKKASKSKKRRYVSDLILYKTGHKVSLAERIVKLLIYVALRLVIRPRKWKDPEKNYEIIDRTYKRIMSSDFIFIPSSIAFYIIMAFMPIIAIVTFITSLPGLGQFSDDVKEVLGDFIPGMKSVLNQTNQFFHGGSLSEKIAGLSAVLVSFLVAIWIASGGFAKLIYTQSYIYEHKFVGGYWMNRIKGMFMVLALTGGLVGALLINVFVKRFIESWDISEKWQTVCRDIFLVFGLLLLVFFGMMALFKFSPRYKVKFRHVVPGAMVTALPTTLFLSLFGIISRWWSYGQYGSIGVIMYIGMMSLIVSNFLFMGLISNAAYYKTFVGLSVEKKWTVSKK